MNLDDALHTFVIESRELLQDMEDALLQLEQNPYDPDLLNAIFRAAHTIKGSAGLFGLDLLVAFTHIAESVLDKMRSGDVVVDRRLIALLLGVCDQLRVLVNHVADKVQPGDDIHEVTQSLEAQLSTYLDNLAGPETALPAKPVEPPPSVHATGGNEAETDNWHLSLRFSPDLLRNGMDPLSFLRYLATFGELVRVVPLTDAIPRADEFDPETCYLGFEISYRSEADKATIEGAFEFVQEDSEVRILPPHSKISEYLRLIDELPQEDLRLGEILVRCGTLTATELDSMLALQAQAGDASVTPMGEVLVAQNLVHPPVVEAALEKQRQIKDARRNEGTMIRVNADKLDEHINLIGELIIASASASLLAHGAGSPELVEAAALLSRLVEEVRDTALTLRMVQIGGTFNRFQRVVRDVSQELGKDIRLEISGAETELDKTVVEKIGDPLTHLVRNAMDHGIEPVEVRVANGKPAHGTLRLNAYHESGSIAIEVSDDGGGLNRDKILAKAIERGLVKPEQPLTDQEIYNLIFEPGFSTADQINNLSGRGVGMDVVRKNITALRGNIHIDTRPGRGTTIRITLPLTLAIIDGFLVGVDKSHFVIPLDMVVECLELREDARGGNYLNLRGEVLPFVRIRDLFDVEGEHPRRENVVVVKSGTQKAGVVVDALHGEFQTVIKPLAAVFRHLRGISGSTILGSGEVALILDVLSMLQLAESHEQAMQEAAAR